MKKKLLLGAMVFALGMTFLSSCTTTRQTISTKNYLYTVGSVNYAIESLGYNLSGTSSDQKNEVYVAAISYSTETGYGSAMNNDYYWYDTYRFTDSVNNTASYQVKYKYSKDDKGGYYVSNVSLAGCDCSNPKDYSKICGYDGVAKQLNYIENDQVSTFDDDAATYTLTYSLILIGCCVPLLFLL